jgi:hypothetical protein
VLSAAINWKVMAWYLACMAALTIAFPQPSYDGPENVTYMRNAVFRDLVLRPFVLPSYYFFFFFFVIILFSQCHVCFP